MMSLDLPLGTGRSVWWTDQLTGLSSCVHFPDGSIYTARSNALPVRGICNGQDGCPHSVPTSCIEAVQLTSRPTARPAKHSASCFIIADARSNQRHCKTLTKDERSTWQK